MKTKPSFFDAHPRGFTRPLSHAEYFEAPLEYASGFHNADVALAADGVRPQMWRGEPVIINPPVCSPGTFGKRKAKLVKVKSLSSLRAQRWLDPREHGRISADNTRRARIMGGAFYQPPPKIAAENRKGERILRAPKPSDHEHAAHRKFDAVQAKKLAKARVPKERKPARPSIDKQIDLLVRIHLHNGVQHTGAKDEPRLRCPEAERAEARQRRRLARQKRPPVTAAERAAALALLASEITVPRPTLATVTEAPPPPVQTLAAVAPSAWGASRL